MQPRITHQVAPDYPEAARRAGVQGTVLLDAVVSVEGAVTQLNVINGPEALSPAAIDAVRWWRYQPYIVNGGTGHGRDHDISKVQAAKLASSTFRSA